MTPESLHQDRASFDIVDVREPYEWEAGRIEGARHIPLAELANRLAEIPEGSRVVAVCRSGQRSAVATALLRGRGFDAENLEGGMRAWSAAGLPFTTPDGRPGRVA